MDSRYSSQANFLLVQLQGNLTARELSRRLLAHCNILIKDLTKKFNGKNYVRVGIRKTEDNMKLVQTIKSLT